MTPSLHFRVWHKQLKKMAFFHEPHIYTNSPTTHLCFDLTDWESTTQFCNDNYTQELDCYGEEFEEDVVLMQSSGLLDLHGNPIFEDDICKVTGGWSGDQIQRMFPLTSHHFWGEVSDNIEQGATYEIIGDVHRNPGLLSPPAA